MLSDVLSGLLPRGMKVKIAFKEVEFTIEHEGGVDSPAPTPALAVTPAKEAESESPRPATKPLKTRTPTRRQHVAPRSLANPDGGSMRDRVTVALKDHPSGRGVGDIADAVGSSYAYVSQILSKGLADGTYQLVNRGVYALALQGSESTNGQETAHAAG